MRFLDVHEFDKSKFICKEDYEKWEVIKKETDQIEEKRERSKNESW